MLNSNPTLYQLYKDLVVGGLITADEFWANRLHGVSVHLFNSTLCSTVPHVRSTPCSIVPFVPELHSVTSAASCGVICILIFEGTKLTLSLDLPCL